jgi:radical SAM superfamily enzyme YgiQ (UPF0313 family)
MRYHGTVIRPPSEAGSYILQVAYGCSHNRCAFCGTYLDKPFRPRETSEILEDVHAAGALMPAARRVFLADHSKLGKAGFVPIMPLNEIDVLITDALANEEIISSLRKQGIEVMVV